MKLTQKQLRAIILKETQEHESKTARLTDVDTGRSLYVVTKQVDFDTISVRFDNNYTLSLSRADCNKLIDTLNYAILHMEDDEFAGENQEDDLRTARNDARFGRGNWG